jgi:hypothetical protein
MGAEGSFEVFQEDELEEELNMTKDESLKEMFNKSLANMVDVLIHPIRWHIISPIPLVQTAVAFSSQCNCIYV